MAERIPPPGRSLSPPRRQEAVPRRVIAGLEPDPVTRCLVGLYLEPLGYSLRWLPSLTAWPESCPGSMAFFLSSAALERLDGAAIREFAGRVGAVPLLGLAGGRRGFPPECVPQPVRRVLRKPVRAEELLSALEGLQPRASPESGGAPLLWGLEVMAAEMGMDTALVADLCRSFIERGEKYLREARAAVHPRDDAALDRVAHAFKGMAGNLRLESLAALAEALRRAAKEHIGDPLALTRSLEGEFAAVRTLLRERWLNGEPAP